MLAIERIAVMGNDAVDKWAKKGAELHEEVFLQATEVLKDDKMKSCIPKSMGLMLAAYPSARDAWGIGSLPNGCIIEESLRTRAMATYKPPWKRSGKTLSLYETGYYCLLRVAICDAVIFYPLSPCC